MISPVLKIAMLWQIWYYNILVFGMVAYMSEIAMNPVGGGQNQGL